MDRQKQPKNIEKKAFESAYIIAKLAKDIGEKSIADMLAGNMARILEASIFGDMARMEKEIRLAEYIAEIWIAWDDKEMAKHAIDDLRYSAFSKEKDVIAVKEQKLPRVKESVGSDNSAKGNRQLKILEIVRELADCSLKDIQDRLPDVSERTVRYDIQTLLDSGKVQRVGNGGPGTFYTLPKAPPISEEPPVESEGIDGFDITQDGIVTF